MVKNLQVVLEASYLTIIKNDIKIWTARIDNIRSLRNWYKCSKKNHEKFIGVLKLYFETVSRKFDDNMS